MGWGGVQGRWDVGCGKLNMYRSLFKIKVI